MLSPGQQKSDPKRALEQLDENGSMLLRERTALAAGRIRVKYRLFSQPSHVKIGKAYMIAITENLPSYTKKYAR